MTAPARTAEPTPAERGGARHRVARASSSTRVDYLADDGLATALFLSLRLPQPLLLEGEAGVGKTEAAKSLAAALDTQLIRLQCYEGIDASEALYEWNYPRQLLQDPLDGVRRRRVRGGRAVRQGVPDAAAAAAGDRARGAAARRCSWSTSWTAPTTTSRPSCSSCWRSPASPSPRSARFTADAAPGGDPDLEPHARPARRAEAPLPVPLDRLPEPRARGRDRAPARAGTGGGPGEPRPPRRCGACARARCRSRPGSPRRSTGWPLSSCSGSITSIPPRRSDAGLGAQVS